MSQSSPEAPVARRLTAQDLLASRTRRENVARGLILLAAFASFVLSVSLWFAGNEQQGIFVGIWVPSIIGLGGFLLHRRTES
jgi:hypothetical protein